eukprot:13595-Chlamydomonas_euryale.AAC.2
MDNLDNSANLQTPPSLGLLYHPSSRLLSAFRPPSMLSLPNHAATQTSKPRSHSNIQTTQPLKHPNYAATQTSTPPQQPPTCRTHPPHSHAGGSYAPRTAPSALHSSTPPHPHTDGMAPALLG